MRNNWFVSAVKTTMDNEIVKKMNELVIKGSQDRGKTNKMQLQDINEVMEVCGVDNEMYIVKYN